VSHPLIEEAGKKAAIVWLGAESAGGADGADGADGRAAWCAWFDDALYVVGGAGEQDPGLTGTATVPVTMRGDHGGRIITWTASVRRVEPGSEEWTCVAPQLAGKRLNAPTSADDLVSRWAAECDLYALRPVDGAAPTAGSDLPSASLAAPPRETPAARPARRPFRLHRVRRPRSS
jgi:hypothetical protein